MAAAEHGATFPKAQAIQASMSKSQMHDFAATKEKGLPQKVRKPNRYGQLGKPR